MLQDKLQFFVACFTVPNRYIVLEFTMISMQQYDFSLQTNEDKIKIFCRTSYLVHSHFILGSLSNFDDDDDKFKKQ